MAQKRDVINDKLPERNYQCRFPAITSISNLQEARNRGCFYIAFERNGYTLDDVEESQLYVYVGKQNEHKNFVPDTASYGDAIDASDGWITSGAMAGASAYPYMITGTGGVREITYYDWNGVINNTTYNVKYNGDTIYGKYPASLSGYDSNPELSKWRKVNLNNRDIGVFAVDSNNKNVISISTNKYTLQRDVKFDNPKHNSGYYDFSGYGSIVDNPSAIYRAADVINDSAEFVDAASKVMLEVHFEDIFYTDAVSYENVPDTGSETEPPKKYSNIDFDPRNGKLQVSTKDRDKLLFDILKGKTPIFFMIVEKLNKSYSGLANLYVTDGDGKITAVSTKQQVIADRYRNVGDVIWDSGVTLTGRTIDRICVDLAQGDEGAYKRNPGFDDLQRTVWVSSHTDSGAYITCYDYYTGNKIFERPFGAYRINAMATNPADRSLVFVMVNNNNDTGFASVNRIYRSGEYSEICKIDDYAKDSAFSMIGAATTANVANRILGGVVAKKSDGNGNNNGFWFTFIVNREFTVSVRISLINGTCCTGDAVKITFADRMHYGLFHGKNFNGVYSNAPQVDDGNIKYGAKRAAHSKYLSGVEYGVKKNRNNVIGITNSVAGDVYVNGHTYFHFDNTSASYSLQQLAAKSPIFSDHTWDHDDGTGNEGCGMRYYEENKKSNDDGYTDRVEPLIKSLVPDLTTGKWKVNSRGKYVTEYRSPFRPGFFPPRTFEVNGSWNKNDDSFTSRAMAHMTAGKHYSQRHDGEHRCSMSMIAWKGRKPENYKYTTSRLGDVPNSWDVIAGGKGDVVKYVNVDSNHVEFTDEVNAGFYNGEAARRRPIRLKDNVETVATGGKFQCGYSDNLTEDYGGSGWNCHMADATMNYSVENDNHGGGMFFIMLESGFIYNANSYDAEDPITASAANYKMAGLCDNNARFWKTNGLSEDSSGQLVFNDGGRIKMVGSVIDFNYFENRIGDSGSPHGAPDAFKFQRGNTSRSVFINKFDCCWADTIYAPKTSGQPASAIGYMEDALWSTDNHPGYRAKTGATVRRVTDYTSSNEIVYGNGEKILMSNYSPKTGHYGMTVPLSANGSLVTRGPSIYESVMTDNKHGVVKANFGDGAAISTDEMCIDGIPSYSVITDDSNQMYVGCYLSDGSKRIDSVLRLNGNKVGGSAYGPVYARDGLQVTNFGHNLCTHPYFEHAAWTTQNDNVTYNYDRYFGAKDLVDTKKLTPDARRDIVLGSFSIGANNINRYNDDSIGMNGVKCLGYCWTRSTKVHPMDVPPSGDLVIIDHYVLPGNDCDDIDTASMGKYSNSPNSDFYSKGVITYAEATTAAAGYPEFVSAVSSLSAVSYSEFTTDRLKVLLSGCEGFSTYENVMKGVEVEDKSESWVSGGRRTVDVVGVGRPKSGLPRAPKTFWDFTTEETLVFDREDDEWAAVMAYAETGMIKTNPIYLSDFSTVVEHPVSYRCAGYDDLYTCHLCSIYDCGTYDIDEVEYTFEQMDDISESNMARKSTRRLRGTELSSMTIGDTDLGRKVAEISKSNNEINYVLDTIQYTSYHDAMCCSADVIQMFGTGWNSINAYGKPYSIEDGAITDKKYMGHYLSDIYGQTVPKQWYGTEVYKWVYEKDANGNDTNNRITYMHQLNNRTSAYGFHPSVYPDAAATGPTGSNMNAFPAGAWVQNARLGLNTNPHLVYAKATTNEFCYCDPHESAKKIELDLGQNKVWVYERWPTQIWSTHCENSRGGLRLFGECPDFDEEN